MNASRASSFSFASEETDEYYEDAHTGMIPGEFFLEEEDGERALDEEDDEDGEDGDDYYEEEEEVEEVHDRTATIVEEDEGEEEVEEKGQNMGEEDKLSTMVVERRKVLPAPASGEEFSMLGMLRKNVGKVSPSAVSFTFRMRY